MASSDSWCQSTIPILASSQAEAQQTQSSLSGSCNSNFLMSITLLFFLCILLNIFRNLVLLEFGDLDLIFKIIIL